LRKIDRLRENVDRATCLSDFRLRKGFDSRGRAVGHGGAPACRSRFLHRSGRSGLFRGRYQSFPHHANCVARGVMWCQESWRAFHCLGTPL